MHHVSFLLSLNFFFYFLLKWPNFFPTSVSDYWPSNLSVSVLIHETHQRQIKGKGKSYNLQLIPEISVSLMRSSCQRATKGSNLKYPLMENRIIPSPQSKMVSQTMKQSCIFHCLPPHPVAQKYCGNFYRLFFFWTNYSERQISYSLTMLTTIAKLGFSSAHHHGFPTWKLEHRLVRCDIIPNSEFWIPRLMKHSFFPHGTENRAYVTNSSIVITPVRKKLVAGESEILQVHMLISMWAWRGTVDVNWSEHSHCFLFRSLTFKWGSNCWVHVHSTSVQHPDGHK